MHLWVVRKNNCVTELLRHRRAAGAGKVTAGGDLQSTPHRVSSAGRQNYRSFLGIYEFIRNDLTRRFDGETCPTGKSHER